MKKKFRNIVVDNIEYAWRTCRYNGDGDGGIGIRIWKDKKIIHETFHEGNYEPITPKTIADIIGDLEIHMEFMSNLPT